MEIQVRVPATTANLGPGFDCLGAALTLYNRFTFSGDPSAIGQATSTPPALEITVSGVNADRVGGDANNLVYQAFCRFYAEIGQPVPPLKLAIDMAVPLARGLGSSATAIVGGLVGANILQGKPLDLTDLAKLATEMEGHPDNVVPALLGGCRLAATGIDHPWEICPISWSETVVPVVAIPAFELSTEAARQVLPTSYSRADAIFNLSHLGLLLQGLTSGKADWLQSALQDRIHQPYRRSLIPGYDAVEQAAIAAGAYGLVISGAGPTLLALANPATAEAVRAAMVNTWEQTGIQTQGLVLGLDHQGTVVEGIEN
ncbi:MAG: homoserine kinase [Synechococcales bacterium]|nr:homoserine kinase [Synechococcales bacterium]